MITHFGPKLEWVCRGSDDSKVRRGEKSFLSGVDGHDRVMSVSGLSARFYRSISTIILENFA